MAKDDQEFSFPTTVETPPPPRFLESPPIWWRTSAASHRENNPKKEDGERGGEKLCYLSSSLSKEGHQRRSFSCIEGRTKRRDDDDDDDDDDDGGEEEKMDMLWEDFNEEYKRSRDLSGKLELKFVQSLKLSKPIKRPRMVVVMKVLKKVFLSHNSHNSIFKKHP